MENGGCDDDDDDDDGNDDDELKCWYIVALPMKSRRAFISGPHSSWVNKTLRSGGGGEDDDDANRLSTSIKASLSFFKVGRIISLNFFLAISFLDSATLTFGVRISQKFVIWFS
jgi:hypothetical protein